MEYRVERAPEHKGWRIESVDQPHGSGMVVTDDWLHSYGFGPPSRSNIDQIIKATYGAQQNITAKKVNPNGEGLWTPNRTLHPVN